MLFCQLKIVYINLMELLSMLDILAVIKNIHFALIGCTGQFTMNTRHRYTWCQTRCNIDVSTVPVMLMGCQLRVYPF